MLVEIPDPDGVYVSGPGIQAALADINDAAHTGLQGPWGPWKLAYIVARCQRLEADWRRASTARSMKGGSDV